MGDVKISSLAGVLRRPAIGFCAGGLLLVGILFGLVAVDRWHSYEAAVAIADRTTQNLARTLEEHIWRTVTSADLVLSAIAYNFASPGGGVGPSRAFAKSVASRLSANGLLSDIEVVDVAGDRVGADLEPQIPLHYADQDYFVAHRDRALNGLYISMPYVNRRSNRWSIALSRRLANADDSFGGVAFAAVDLGYFQDFYATLDVGPGGIVAMWNDEGRRILLERPADHMLQGRVFDEGGLVRQLEERRQAGTIREISPIDGIERVISYRRVSGLPFVVSAGISSEAYLASWRRDTVKYAAVTLAVDVVILLLTFVLYRQWKRRAATEARLQDFAAVGSDWFWETDAEHRFTLLSEAARNVLSLPLETYIGRSRWTIPEVATPEAADGIAKLRALHEARQPFKNFVYAIRGTAGLRHVEISGRPVFAAGGQFTGYRGVGADVTERRRQEIAVAESRSQLQTVIDTLPARISVKDRELRYVLVNVPQAEEFGCSPAAAIGKRKEDFAIGGVPEDASKAFIEDLQSRDHRVLETGEAILNFEETLPQTNGAVRSTLSSKIPLHDGKGRVNAVLTVALDITERKKIETELLAAREAAEQASRTKSQFLANMSHELRTPLNAVIGFPELMKTQLFGPLGDSRYVGYAADIAASGSHLLSIINDILDLARVESGKLELHEEAVGIDDVARSCGRLVQERASEAGVRLDIVPARDMPFIRADEIRMKQVLLNLLSNAVKFTPRGGRVTFSAVRDEVGDIILKVSDTGIGMSAEEIELALQPFRQIDNTLARKHGGTGLGLPLTKTLVEMQGGRLDIASESGRGTTISVIFPSHRLMPQQPGWTSRAGSSRLAM